MKVAFADVGIAGKPYETEVLAAATRVLKSGNYIGGPEVEALEREFAEFCGAAEAVTVRTGTDALTFALRAAGVGLGDEVISVPLTFIATAEAISHVGATPVFVDVDAATGLMDTSRVAAAITRRTRAILPVHLWGQPVEMNTLMALGREHGLTVIEDACQAHGAEYRGRRTGNLGDLAAFSFYPSKNLGACGEGGMVTARDPGALALVRRLRDHGQAARYQHEVIGYNGRLDALQAAILRVKLRALDAANAQRRKLALRYEEALGDIPGIVLPRHPAHVLPVWHLYVIQMADRNRVRDRLSADGIETGLHYPTPVHLQRAYRYLGYQPGDFPISEQLAGTILSLPFHPDLGEAQIAYVADCLRRAL
jgi:dTDP-4-amino-4,6-dideoxygalactose transaminase